MPLPDPALSHLRADGSVHMVDVSGKAPTKRRAVATGAIRMPAETLALVRDGRAKKGDVLAVARVAGIMAAKRTADLIPLCHPLPLASVAVDLALGDDGITATATVETTAVTGVEMEALTAVSVALLTIYDMVKSAGHGMTIDAIRLVEKTGGKSDWHAG